MLKVLIAAFSIYSRIPMPQLKWKEDEAEYILCFFPLVGLVIAAAEYLVWKACGRLGIPAAAAAALLCAVPLLLDGGIHADGFADTMDARSSYASRDKKLAILKDPHIGAFGVIRLILYFLLLYAVMHSLLDAIVLSDKALLLCLSVPVYSRVLSALAAKLIPPAKKDGMLSPLAASKGRLPLILLIAELVLCVLLLFYLDLPAALALAGVNFILYVYYRRMALKEFGGVSGDTAGWYLCAAQLLSLWTILLIKLLPGVFV